jgi:type I restriction-modification system DNA methylase subunit
MAQEKRQQAILSLFKDFKGIEQLKELFWAELNYERVNQPLSMRDWKYTVTNLLTDDPLLFAAGGDNAFAVIYARFAADSLLLTHERPIVTKLLREHPYALFVFSNTDQDRWHFINVKHDEDVEKRRIFRRITIGPEERLRTASERIALLDLALIDTNLFGISPLAIQKCHDEAFDVEAVTEQFFKEYKEVFRDLQNDLERQTKDKHWAHDYALQFLNRCMFLYFIQRKGWLGGDREFLRTFWETYNDSSQPPDTFVDKWLKVMFFEAFNGKPIGAHRHLPDNIRNVLALAPFLNGGLFSENNLDKRPGFVISDSRFKQVFTFLERYNFTIAEDSPLDQEVAVDPEMIGKVYESLVNVSEETTERGDAGIFYTPRIEITLMCRLALVDHLANHLGEQYKSLLYELIFAIEPDEKSIVDKKCTDAKLWDTLATLFSKITILDPACGSGSFLVGMLYLLHDLRERTNKQLGKHENSYELKKQIIGESLYGVDVMDWACHVAELRLWLALIADAEFTSHDLHIRREPLLPHFSFKVRCGDSLVQEIGGINFGHTHTSHKILPSLKARITKLKDEKLKFYNNDPERKFHTIDEIKHEELRLFQDILDSRGHKLQEEIKDLRRKIEGPEWRNVRLDGTVEERPHQMELEVAAWQKQIDALKLELEQIEQSRSAIITVKDIPFVWDIAFVEIFEGEKEGFDIVIGNPPYVRQENIAVPCTPQEETTTENKKAYKEKLACSVYHAFPRFFGFNESKGAAARKLNAKSDLYIYFYFHGLSLLNSKGSFCFITSNSWLDVGYGKDLQEFLLKHGHVKLILDNQVKRSFASADVNTVIVLFSSPDDGYIWAVDKTARFVMFKVPFEHILSPVIFEEIEETGERAQTKEYRLFPVRQEELLKDGCEQGEEDEETKEEGRGTKDIIVRDKKSAGVLIKSVKYIGNKWGGKYLRAPDIYWTILEKGKGKLVRLGDIAEVRFGIKTGANEFFYLDEAKIRQWGIEEEFLKPVISSTSEIKRLAIKREDSTTFLFSCPFTKQHLKKHGYKHALGYIEWGSQQYTTAKGKHTIAGVLLSNAPTVRVHKPEWYCIEPHKPGDFIVPRLIRERFFFADNPDGVSETDMFFHGYANKEPRIVSALLNCTFSYLILEIVGRQGIEGRFNVYGPELEQIIILDPVKLTAFQHSSLNTAFLIIGKRDILKIIDEVNQPDRRALDSIIFDALNLTQGEREAVYEAVINLVESRLKKAGSV